MVRFKNRYLLAQMRWHDGRVDDTLSDTVLLGRLRQGVALNFGDVSAGAALASMAVRYFNPVTGLAIVRCGRDMHREVWATMTLMREVKGRSLAVRVLHNGSTLRSSQQAALTHSTDAYRRLVARGVVNEKASARGVSTAAAVIEGMQP